MVSTRTQDGTISTKTYSPLTLDLNALSLQSPLPSPSTSTRSTRHHGLGTPTKVLKPGSPRKSSRRTPRTPISAKKQKFVNIAASEANANASMSTARSSAPPPTPRTRPATKAKAKVTFVEAELPLSPRDRMLEHGVDFLEGNTFFPSITIGAKERVGLSKLGRADKEVEMWEGILAEHREKMHSLVPVVEEKLWEAKHKRACMDETLAENVMIGDVNPAESIIKSRLEVLEWALSTSRFGPEAENIKCAIAGYKSGEIGYNDHFTVIYAAHIVGTVAMYSEFVRDRTEMLDRYCATHGPDWMWYEPPLNVHPESNPKLWASVALEREDLWTALGGWHVNQGFWKRSGYVARMSQAKWVSPGVNHDQYERHPENPNLVNCQAEGPRLSFRSMLDLYHKCLHISFESLAGATFPSLHNEDLLSLNIDMANYSAQSVSACQTANGVVMVRLFELFVCVLDNDGKQLVDPNNAVYPLSHKYLGGLCPVSQCPTPLTWDANGIPTPHRLSGILPFLASYVSSTPTRNTLYLGEDRNSVLGAHRMPGQRKWSIELGPIVPGLPFDRYGEPKIRFSHRGGRLVDEDDAAREGVSYLVVNGEGGEDGEGEGQGRRVVVVSDPATRQREMREEEELRREEGKRVERERMRGLEEEERVRGAVGGLLDEMRNRGMFGEEGFGSGGPTPPP
ncbi:hypothetical protein BKA65DRAFT_539736 [Rhexocercosporidium sp. MPI-PUGE-AT-0058]|nr:hypothetical protein BKA65DRAFT_539736 [Rhexocercosporidium sp. MPI-PUGE-AT-0058]